MINDQNQSRPLTLKTTTILGRADNPPGITHAWLEIGERSPANICKTSECAWPSWLSSYMTKSGLKDRLRIRGDDRNENFIPELMIYWGWLITWADELGDAISGVRELIKAIWDHSDAIAWSYFQQVLDIFPIIFGLGWEWQLRCSVMLDNSEWIAEVIPSREARPFMMLKNKIIPYNCPSPLYIGDAYVHIHTCAQDSSE